MKSVRTVVTSDYSERVRALVVVAVLCAVSLSGCGSGKEEAAPYPPPEATQPAPSADRPAAPAVEGVGLAGEHVSLADLRGSPVFVNVWSSW